MPAPHTARAAWRRLAGGAAALALAACATLPEFGAVERVHAGRFAATTVLDGRSENTTGRFTLAVAGHRLLLDLSSPLGTTLARIESGAGGAVLRLPGDGEREVRGRDAEALAEELLGWTMPVAGIADWIVGRPDPRRPSRAFADGAGGQGFEQDGWQIELAERFGDDSPRRLVMTRPARAAVPPTPPAPAITLRLVLDEPAPRTMR
jgi:outer membrane lipoprotein LolB